MSKNLAYLQSLVAELQDIPRRVGEKVAKNVFDRLAEDTALDSGQAALSWHLEPYFGTPRYKKFEILWGTPDSPPRGGAGYKSIYSMLGPTGSYGSVLPVLEQRARTALSRTGGVTGYVVYNTITETALSTALESRKYFDNALKVAEDNLPRYLEEALNKAYSEVSI